MKRRNKIEIAALILESLDSKNNLSKTAIMYNAFLTYAQLKQLLPHLVKSGLLEESQIQESKRHHIYRLTDKGKHFLEIYNQIRVVIDITEQIRTV